MTGVNDLLREWLRDGDCYEGGITAGKEVLGDELQELARTAWHPVSEPPTEADGDRDGDIMLYDPQDGEALKVPWDVVYDMDPEYQWARINDVILLPPA